MQTNRPIEYSMHWAGRVTIPAGTRVTLASNLPPGDDGARYWAQPWRGMPEKARGWIECYGFLIDAADVEA